MKMDVIKLESSIFSSYCFPKQKHKIKCLKVKIKMHLTVSDSKLKHFYNYVSEIQIEN